VSWTVWLLRDGEPIGNEWGWDYTHNTSRMIYAVLEDLGVVLPADTAPCRWYDRETGEWHNAPEGHGTIPWWMYLGGMGGAEGHFLLRRVIDGLTADPDRFRAMNPENGWGDYEGLIRVLCEMRDASAVEDPSLVWHTSG
jgi:hypothetical protein